MRALPSTLASLALLSVTAVACSAAPGDDASGQTSQGLTIKRFPPTLAECEAEFPACSTFSLGSDPWAYATPEELSGSSLSFQADRWIAILESVGCSTPVGLHLATGPDTGGGVVTLCPASAIATLPNPEGFLAVSQLPDASDPYGNLEMGCNHCYPTGAPAGYVYLMWNPDFDSPSGCKNGSCGGLM